MSFWNIVTIGSALILTILILVQVRGAGLGAGLGGSGSTEMNTVRRGSDKTVFNMTIVMAVVFGLSIVLELILV